MYCIIARLPLVHHFHCMHTQVRDVEPPYAELKEAPKTRKGGGASKGETVSKAKFDLLKERLKKVQVWHIWGGGGSPMTSYSFLPMMSYL